MKSLVLMLQFLTRLPIGQTIDCDEKDFRKGIVWFTTVGAILGIILVGVGVFLSTLRVSPMVVATLLVTSHVVLTGGLHLDGLSDSADGLLSNRPAERMLEIMKDSRIGANGVIALILVLLVKVALIAELVLRDDWWPILLFPILGRFLVTYAMKRGHSPRTQGMGNLFIGHAHWGTLAANVLPLLILTFFEPRVLLMVPLGLLLVEGIIKSCHKKIGGITGDVLGAMIELGETLCLIVAVLVW